MRDASADDYVTTVATFIKGVGILCHGQVRIRVLKSAFDNGIQRGQVEGGIERRDGRNKSGNIAITHGYAIPCSSYFKSSSSSTCDE